MANVSNAHDQYLVSSLPVLVVYAESLVTQSQQQTHTDHSLLLLAEICQQIRREGFCTIELGRYSDFFDLGSQQHFSALIFALPSLPSTTENPILPQTQPSESQLAEPVGEYPLLGQIVQRVRRNDKALPIFLYGKQRAYGQLCEDVIRHTTGFIHYGEDTVEFSARYVSREALHYLKTSLPPFFGKLMEYVCSGSYSWHCPGHSGGTAFLKSPVGQIFRQFFGENLLRADVCNAVEGLGQLLQHSGRIGASERNAARVFGADRLYFVTNGTSTSNKVVACANIAQGDVVLVDRNCHQSILHALIQSGAIPIFLQPGRNAYGIAGPIPEEQFEPQWLRAAVQSHPLASAGSDATELPKALLLTQSTYDGILYNADTIKQKLDGLIPLLHFDEAWIPHAVFHEFYFAMHALGPRRPAAKHSTIYATQSPHKMLAGLSQASQILVQDASLSPRDPAPLEAALLMHSSTSPQYSILASLDVSSAMMAGAHGKAIVEEALIEALGFRQALRKHGQNLRDQAPNHWWFQDWGPPHFHNTNPPAPNLPTPNLCQPPNLSQVEWHLNASDSDWHGFGKARSADFNMLDPLKCTLLTPGLDAGGQLEPWGIPAAVVSRYLEENGIIVEKTGLYSIFVMFAIGITKGRWKGLLSALQRFKADYDSAQSLWRSMPQLCRQYPQYAELSLPQLCQQIHQGYRQNRLVEQTNSAYNCLPLAKMTPCAAYQAFVRGQYQSLRIADICGRICASAISVYPPGIPLLFPGEQVSAQIQDYLHCLEQQQHEFPGFGIHVCGVGENPPQDSPPQKYSLETAEPSFVVNVLV